MRARRLVLLTALLLVAAAAFAQSLMDDPGYRTLVDRAASLRAQAQEAYDAGRYDDSIRLSTEAEAVAREAEEYAEQRVLAYRANSWIRRARTNITNAERLQAPERYPEEWRLAQRHIADAEAAFTAGQWAATIEASRLVVSALENVGPLPIAQQPAPAAAPAPAPAPTPPPAPTVQPAPAEQPAPAAVTGGLPRYYVVRLIPQRRDCFWRIAEYDFVYGDPWLWRVLYEANKHKLPDPNNPDWMEPGMIIEIPSIAGELRDGTWDPGR